MNTYKVTFKKTTENYTLGMAYVLAPTANMAISLAWRQVKYTYSLNNYWFYNAEITVKKVS